MLSYIKYFPENFIWKKTETIPLLSFKVWMNTILLLSTFTFKLGPSFSYGDKLAGCPVLLIPLQEIALDTQIVLAHYRQYQMPLGWFQEIPFCYKFALFRLQRSEWAIRSSRSSLQHLEMGRLEFTISYLALKSFKRPIVSENF